MLVSMALPGAYILIGSECMFACTKSINTFAFTCAESRFVLSDFSNSIHLLIVGSYELLNLLFLLSSLSLSHSFIHFDRIQSQFDQVETNHSTTTLSGHSFIH